MRVCIRGRWRAGTARLLAGDAAPRQALPRLNTAIVRVVGDDVLTVRVDLD